MERRFNRLMMKQKKVETYVQGHLSIAFRQIAIGFWQL